MLTLEYKTENFILKSLGLKVFFEPQKKLANFLPIYLTSLYKMRLAKINGENVLFAFSNETQNLNTIEIQRHQRYLKTQLKREVVFVFENLSTRTTQRVIQKGISLVVLGRDIFLPTLLTKVRIDRSAKKSVSDGKPLPMWAEVILIRQLCHRDLNQLSGIEIAQFMGTSPMNVSRGISALVSAQICSLSQSGSAKKVKFVDEHELWKFAQEQLTSPVAQTFYTTDLPRSIKKWNAGHTALSRLSLLVDDEIPTVAIDAHDMKFLPAQTLTDEGDENTKYRVQAWRRNPMYTAVDDCVDQISLYFSVDRSDARVNQAMLNILEKFGLGIQGRGDDV